METLTCSKHKQHTLTSLISPQTTTHLPIYNSIQHTTTHTHTHIRRTNSKTESVQKLYPFPEHYPSLSAKRARERYMLSEMGNNGVKTRSGRCDNDKGDQWEEGEDDRGVPHLLILHTRSQASGGQHTCMAASGSSLRTGQHGRNENKKVKGGCRRFKWKKR